MDDKLVLDSLKVQGFRAFEDLQIEKLGRVNLITGKNNVGKTCLLEALQVYARRGEPNVLQSLLRRRDETYVSNSMRPGESMRLLDDVRHVFHGRLDGKEAELHLVIGSLLQWENQVGLSVKWELMAPEEPPVRYMVDGKLVDPFGQEIQMVRSSNRVFALRFGAQTRTLPFVPQSFYPRNIAQQWGDELHHTFIWSQGLDAKAMNALWDEIALSDTEAEVILALKIVAPTATRVNLVNAREGNPDRVAMVRLSDGPEAIPMKSLGEGMNRLFGLSLALVSSGGGLLLVDEIETGLHYSVQADMWRLVFKTAKRLNIQVFATTHSRDCYKAFEQVAREETETEGVLIRLENKQGKVAAVSFDERRLEIATREGIEVR